MDEFVSTCDLLTSEFGATTTLVCVVLGTLLLALIALGFGPLRSWLAPAVVSRSTRHFNHWNDGLRDIWYLSRQLRSSERRSLPIFCPKVRSSIVPGVVGAQAKDDKVPA